MNLIFTKVYIFNIKYKISLNHHRCYKYSYFFLFCKFFITFFIYVLYLLKKLRLYLYFSSSKKPWAMRTHGKLLFKDFTSKLITPHFRHFRRFDGLNCSAKIFFLHLWIKWNILRFIGSLRPINPVW